MYTLIGSERSPFVRTCRMLMITNKIPFDFKILNFVQDAVAAAELAQESPVNKVPILIDGGQKIFDSRVIVQYLMRKHSLRSLSLDEENTVTSIYSVLDSGVAIFLLKQAGIDARTTRGMFFERNVARIPANFAWLKPWVELLRGDVRSEWHYPTMALYSCLYWGEKREIFKVSDYPHMQGFMRKFAGAPGVKETSFD